MVPMRRTVLARFVIPPMLLVLASTHLFAQSPTHGAVQNLKITILSTMLSAAGIGEWGFAALVEADRHRLLVDTGAELDTVLLNALELNLDHSDVREGVLTHNHD